VLRILEWEGSRYRRCGGGWEWLSPSSLGEKSGEGAVALPKNFFTFLLKIPYFDAFWHVYFLNHTPMGVLTQPP